MRVSGANLPTYAWLRGREERNRKELEERDVCEPAQDGKYQSHSSRRGTALREFLVMRVTLFSRSTFHPILESKSGLEFRFLIWV